MLASLFAPIGPALSAAGFVKVIQILAHLTGLVNETSLPYVILGILSDTVFYFLPVYLAYTCAKKFHTNEILSTTLACFLINPSLIELFNSGNKIVYLGLPVTATSYSSSVIPIILSVYVMSKLDKILTRIIPDTVKNFLRPLCLI